MSENFYLSARNCLEWSLERPFCDSVRKSPTFSCLGNEWYFEFRASYYSNKTRYSFYINRADSKKVLHGDARVRVFIHSVRMEWIKYVGTLTLEEDADLHRLEGIEISDNDRYGHWIVYCIFSDDLPSELHIKESEAKHLTSSLTAQSNLPDRSSIIMKAKLAANSADNSLSDEEILSTDFGKLLEQQTSSDVTLTCGDRTFAAHRLILAARSEVFAAMFQNKMIESETCNINIEDIDGEVFELLLKYMYTGKIFDHSVDTASRLHIAADKYSIQSLKIKCSKWMLGSLSEQNCLDFLVISDTLNDQMLKERLINFVAEIMHLLERDEWQKFSDTHPKLALSVYQRRTFAKPV